MAETVTPLHRIGHNRPPEDQIIDPHDPAILRARLEREYASMLQRFVELELGAKKTPVIASEAKAKEVQDFLKGQCDDAIADAKKAHDREKRPFLQACRTIDEFFLRRIDRFRLAIQPTADRHATFVLQKEAEDRAREAEARRLARIEADRHAAEQRRLEEEARQQEAAGNRREAMDKQRQAEQEQHRAEHATAVAEAPDAPTRMHGELTRSTSYVVTTWKFEIADPAALPPRYWKPDEELIQSEIDDGVRAIPGVDIWSVKEVRSRSC